MNIHKIALSLPMPPDNDAGARTVRHYLTMLAQEMWENEEGANGKRPFGNSGWKSEVLDVLVDAGLVDEQMEADRIIREALEKEML